MKIKLSPKHRPFAINVTTAYSTEFAKLIRELEKKRAFESIKGEFEIYRSGEGKVTIEIKSDFLVVE